MTGKEKARAVVVGESRVGNGNGVLFDFEVSRESKKRRRQLLHHLSGLLDSDHSFSFHVLYLLDNLINYYVICDYFLVNHIVKAILLFN